MAIEKYELQTVFTGNSRAFDSSSASVLSKTKSLIKGLGAAAAASYALKKATDFVSESFRQASNLEQYRNTLNIVMKDQEKAADMMRFAVDLANKTPFDTTSVVDATVKLQSYGVSATDTLEQIGDMAAVMNKDLDQAVEAVADAQTGELERLKEFGITKQMIIDQAAKTMRGKQIVNNKNQITDQEAFNEALFSLMKERFEGGMESQAKTLKGAFSTVQGVFKTTMASMVGVSATGEIEIGGAFDRVRGLVAGLAERMQEWSEDGTIDRISSAFGSALTFIFDKGEMLFDTFANHIIPTFSNLFDLIKPALPEIEELFSTSFKTAIEIINLTFDAISKVINALRTAGEWLDKIRGEGPEFSTSRFDTGQTRMRTLTGDQVLKFSGATPTESQTGNPNGSTTTNNTSTVNNSPVININGTNKSTDEIMNEIVPKLTATMSNM